MEDFLEECAPFQTSESHYAIARPYLPYCYYCVQNATGADRYNLRNYDFDYFKFLFPHHTLHNIISIEIFFLVQYKRYVSVF